MSRSSASLGVFLCQFLASCAGLGDPWTELRVDLDAMIERTAGRGTEVSAKVISLRTGEVVYARRPGMLLHPASTMKVLTVATALRNGLARNKVSTKLIGSPDGQGPLYLRGGGDPFLSAEELESMVDQLRAGGVEIVTGPLVVDASLFTGPRFGFGWMWDDEPGSFMPHISALTVEGGCVEVLVSAEAVDVAGRPVVSLYPRSEHVRLVNGATVGVGAGERGGGVLIDRDWQNGGRTITVKGKPRHGETIRRRLSVPGPAVFAGRVLKSLLVDEDLAADSLEVVAMEMVGPAGRPANDSLGYDLAKVDRSIEELIIRLTKESDNLAAENLLRLLAVHREGRPAGARRGLGVVRAYLRELGFDPPAYRLADGSGLSHLNLLSADVLVAVLSDMRRRPETARLFQAALPVAGVDGTLRTRMASTRAAGRVRAKTGTLSGVSALAGYAETTDGEPLAFAFLMQNFVGPSAPWRELQDRMAVRLVEGRSE